MTFHKVPRDEAVHGIVAGLILIIITCGLYDLYWNAKQMRTINGLLEREELFFWTWLFISILTYGIFHLYYEYKMALALMEIQEKYGARVDEHLHIISLLLSLFGFSIVVDAIHQNEINKVYERIL